MDKNNIGLLILEQNVCESFSAAFKDFTKLSKKVKRNQKMQFVFNSMTVLCMLYLSGKIEELREFKESKENDVTND